MFEDKLETEFSKYKDSAGRYKSEGSALKVNKEAVTKFLEAYIGQGSKSWSWYLSSERSIRRISCGFSSPRGGGFALVQ